jgi:hypothetical protein
VVEHHDELVTAHEECAHGSAHEWPRLWSPVVDAESVLQADLSRRGVRIVGDLSEPQIVDLTLRYAVWIPVDTYVDAPWLAPFAVRRFRARTDDRAPGPARDLWGFPDEDGYFTDDNSLIKGTFRNRRVRPDSPYGSAKLSKGMVCCHVWAGTTGDPLLFSFVPNLVWVPRSLAGYTDGHLAGAPHAVHETLKRAAIGRYREVQVQAAHDRVEMAWQRLGDGIQPLHVPQHEFDVDGQIVDLVHRRLDRLIELLEASLGERPPSKRRFSKRYHGGVGSGIDRTLPAVRDAVPEDRRRRLLAEMRACRA